MKPNKPNFNASMKSPEQMKKEWELFEKAVESYNEVRIPTEEEVDALIAVLVERLEDKKINKYVNIGLKLGFNHAKDILEKGIKSYDDFDFSSISSIQARAIAMLAIDFLNGNRIAEDTFKNVPLKDK